MNGGRLVPRPWTTPQRGVLIALLAAMLVYLAVRLILSPQYVSDPQPADPARAQEVEDRIDPNTADAATLAALPLIGEKRAADIVAYRERFLTAHPGRIAFSRPQELLRVKGIGAVTLSQIEPYLLFPARSQSTTHPIAPGSVGG